MKNNPEMYEALIFMVLENLNKSPTNSSEIVSIEDLAMNQHHFLTESQP